MLLLNLLISDAMASGSPAAGGDVSSLTSVVWVFLPILAVFYFTTLRPHQKRVREFEEMAKALKRGDKIVTGGGVLGTIHKVEGDDILVVEVAPDIKVRVMRDTVSHVVSKSASETANDNDAGVKSEKKK